MRTVVWWCFTIIRLEGRIEVILKLFYLFFFFDVSPVRRALWAPSLVSLDRRGSMWRRRLEVSLAEVLVGLLAVQHHLKGHLMNRLLTDMMTFLLGLREPLAKRARRDSGLSLVGSSTDHLLLAGFPSLGDGAALRQRSLLVSKTVSCFARYPDRRPAGVVPAADGSLDQIWVFSGRRLRFSRQQLLQHLVEHAIGDSGRRRFLLRSDLEGRTWVSVAEPVRRVPRRHRHRPRRGTHRDEDEANISKNDPSLSPCATHLAQLRQRWKRLHVTPVSVPSADDDSALSSGASLEPDDAAIAAPGIALDVKLGCARRLP